MLPKVEKVSYRALLSMEFSKFLIKMLPIPDFRRPGSRWDHIIRMGWPLTISKFIVSSARSAGGEGRRERGKSGDICDPESSSPSRMEERKAEGIVQSTHSSHIAGRSALNPQQIAWLPITHMGMLKLAKAEPGSPSLGHTFRG